MKRLAVVVSLLILCFASLAAAQDAPSLATDKPTYVAGETITITGQDWSAGENVTIVVSAEGEEESTTLVATADASGAFSVTTTMPEPVIASSTTAGLSVHGMARRITPNVAENGKFHATAKGARSNATAQAEFSEGENDTDGARLLQLEDYWNDRLTFPTGKFNPGWVRKAAEDDKKVTRGTPKGRKRGHSRVVSMSTPGGGVTALSLVDNMFTALGPQPERMTGCSGCFDYTTTQGRVNTIAIDPTTTTPGSIVAYIGTVGGGVWKTTNCCSASTTWTITTDDPLINTTSIDTVTIDPSNHNTIYAGTGDLNYGSFSMGSQGVLKSTDAGAHWTVLGSDIFGAALPQTNPNFPQYQAVGKVRVDPNNSNNVVAGTKTGLYLSYDGGANWTGPCVTNGFATMRQDITGLELSNMGGGVTRILASVGVRGFASTVQFNLGQNGANGIYNATMPASGCPSFSSIASNANGFVFGTAVTGSPYATGANLNAGSGVIWGGNVTTGNQLGRVELAVAPSNPNTIYAQVQSIALNNNAGCGNTNGCQLGVFASTNGGTTWTFMAGSQGGALRNCAGGNTSSNPGDYPQNWYDQGIAVDPNNPDRIFVDTYDTWLATRTGTAFFNVTCGYNGGAAANHVVHVDHHALAFLPGSSSLLLEGSDGGIFSTSNANAASPSPAVRPTWVNMDNGLNTIEFYSGDISGNFASSAAPAASGGAQDNGPSSVLFAGSPTGPAQWQMGLGGDGFYSRIDPVGTGTSLRFWQGNNSGGLSRCIGQTAPPANTPFPCTNGGATWSSKMGGWGGDQQSFILPFDIFRGGIPGGDDCPPAAAAGGCGHLIAGTTRVFETINGNAANTNGTVTWVVTNNPTTQNLTKGSGPGNLGNRSFINQVKYAPKKQNIAIVGTNDANVWIGFNLGTGVAAAANWVNVTGGNTTLPLRPVLGIALDPVQTTSPIGYAAVGGFNANSAIPGHVFRVVCGANCASFTWTDKTGNLPDIPVDSIIVNPNFPSQVFAGTDFGLYYTDDITAGSPVWQRFANLPAVMIWDMQIDRGSTTLSLWTRSRGAYVWPLSLGPENPLPTQLAVDDATANYRDPITLKANLTSGGNPLPTKTVTFSLNGIAVGSAITDGGGTATLLTILPNSINFGTYGGGVSASFAGEADLYAPTSGTGALNVNKRPISGFVTAANKEYDGTTSAVISSRFLTGVLPPDVVSYLGGTANFFDPNAGIGKSVVATGLSLGGPAANNYSVNSTASTTADITPAPLTVTADDKARLYSTPNPPLTASYSGFKNGETLATSGVTGAPVLATTAVASSPAGTYPITIARGTLSATNYSFVTANGTLTVYVSGIVGLESASVGGSKALVDSYDSTGNYPDTASSHALLLSNGPVSVKGQINGNVLSSANAVNIDPNGAVSGDITAGTTISNKGTVGGSQQAGSPSGSIAGNPVPNCGSYTASPDLSGDKYSYSDGDLKINGGSTVTLGDGTYCFHSIAVTGNATLRVNGNVSIRLTGTLQVNGGSLVNSTQVPSKLQIATSYSGANGVSLGGNSASHLTLYAPQTDVTITGGSPLFGAVLGKTLTISGNSQVHYDVTLPQIWAVFGF